MLCDVIDVSNRVYFITRRQMLKKNANFFCCLSICARRRVLESGGHAGVPKLSLQQEGFAGNVHLA